jgi:hypothetical protein
MNSEHLHDPQSLELINLELIEVTGCRVTGAMFPIGRLGPKHHAIILGRNVINGLVYIAELLSSGYQISTMDDFKKRYHRFGKIFIEPAENITMGVSRARAALSELIQNQKPKYHLLSNNCESFVDRASGITKVSTQVKTTIGILIFVGGVIWLLKKRK